MRIIEQLVASKTGKIEDNADFIAVTSDFIAVFDGRTARSDLRWHDESGGRIAARTLAARLQGLPADADAGSAGRYFNRVLMSAYDELDIPNDTRELTTSAAVFSKARREVWLIGDCQALIDGHPFENRKTIDDVLSDIRSLVLELKLLQGVSFEQLHREDPGRQFIQPLLKMQHLLQNNSGSMFGYPVLDGTSLSGNGIQVRQVASGETQIVLASDGYPVLKPTLADSESYLTTILAEDPLLFRAFRSTKGLSPGNQSFDDRAYIRFRIEARG